MENDQKSRGGRVAQKSAIYYGKKSVRDSNTRAAKRKFGSLAVDVIDCSQERIAQSDFFLFFLSEKNLQNIISEDEISIEDFKQVITFCTYEREMFDRILYENQILFSIDLVRTFNEAGLFRNRKYGIEHILRVANSYRPGHPPLTVEDELEKIALGGKPALTPSPSSPAENSGKKTSDKLPQNGSTYNAYEDPDLPF